jgi:acetyltransferase-like isoleucine patch superfamily enzyme
MKDSGSNTKRRLKKSRKDILDFYRSSRKKIVVDIQGLAYPQIDWIVDGGPWSSFRALVRYSISAILYPMPFSRIKVFFYRACGMKIGKNVYIAPAVYIDILRPQLISIGDNVMIGMGVNIVAHERTLKMLSMGRVKIGSNVTIGGMTIIRNGVTIGDDVEIDMKCNITKSVPRGRRIVAYRNGMAEYGNDY